MSDTTTPSSRWAADGQRDPHGDRYACERAALALGNLTDDELANAVFLHGNEQPTMADMAAGKALAGIVYLTAAKDRIRWLSRALADAIAPQPAELAEQQGDAPEIEQLEKLVSSILSTVSLGHQTGPHAYAGEDFGRYLREATSDCRTILRMLPTLAATGKQQVGVPDGWKLVPIEPTWDMRNEGREFLIEGMEHQPERAAYFLWKTMVAAAPEVE